MRACSGRTPIPSLVWRVNLSLDLILLYSIACMFITGGPDKKLCAGCITGSCGNRSENLYLLVPLQQMLRSVAGSRSCYDASCRRNTAARVVRHVRLVRYTRESSTVVVLRSTNQTLGAPTPRLPPRRRPPVARRAPPTPCRYAWVEPRPKGSKCRARPPKDHYSRSYSFLLQ